jgi:hypothetical protein
MPGVSQHSSPGGGLHWRIPQVVVAATSVMLGGTLCVLLLAACDSRVTTVVETCVEMSFQ